MRNSIIELDCGFGKRYLQYELIQNTFKNKRIILILQASTSLHETFRYFRDEYKLKDMAIIHSSESSVSRINKLENARVILSLPQTLLNTIVKKANVLRRFDVVLINEIDLIIRRRSQVGFLKFPYTKLLNYLNSKLLIGMSGTLRDEHYIFDTRQVKVRKEIQSLSEILDTTQIITMDMVLDSDIHEFMKITKIVPTSVIDDSIELLSIELEKKIEVVVKNIVKNIKEYDSALADEIEEKPHKIFETQLEVPAKLIRKFTTGYLFRKFLWALPGINSAKHLKNYGIDRNLLRETVRFIPNKFNSAFILSFKANKSVILCSYISTCELLRKMFENAKIQTFMITGKTPQIKRDRSLQEFKTSSKKAIAILSNVGERDLDIPESDLLIIFDLVRTTKTVYQKLKRTRGGTCRILYYSGTAEERKMKSVVSQMIERYPWSSVVEPPELPSHQILSRLHIKNNNLPLHERENP